MAQLGGAGMGFSAAGEVPGPVPCSEWAFSSESWLWAPAAICCLNGETLPACLAVTAFQPVSPRNSNGCGFVEHKGLPPANGEVHFLCMAITTLKAVGSSVHAVDPLRDACFGLRGIQGGAHTDVCYHKGTRGLKGSTQRL